MPRAVPPVGLYLVLSPVSPLAEFTRALCCMLVSALGVLAAPTPPHWARRLHTRLRALSSENDAILELDVVTYPLSTGSGKRGLAAVEKVCRHTLLTANDTHDNALVDKRGTR